MRGGRAVRIEVVAGARLGAVSDIVVGVTRALTAASAVICMAAACGDAAAPVGEAAPVAPSPPDARPAPSSPHGDMASSPAIAAVPPTRLIFLHRGPIELRPGIDDPIARTSEVLARASNQPLALPGFDGTDAQWASIRRCVTNLYGAFDVTVTDQDPGTTPHHLVVVGGRSRGLGLETRTLGGIAAFTGASRAPSVVFAFAREQANDPQAVCETIASEVAHAYGLDHVLACDDVMTYLPACGPKAFRAVDAPCGERAARRCASGAPTQNSFAMLRALLGPPR